MALRADARENGAHDARGLPQVRREIRSGEATIHETSPRSTSEISLRFPYVTQSTNFLKMPSKLEILTPQRRVFSTVRWTRDLRDLRHGTIGIGSQPLNARRAGGAEACGENTKLRGHGQPDGSRTPRGANTFSSDPSFFSRQHGRRDARDPPRPLALASSSSTARSRDPP